MRKRKRKKERERERELLGSGFNQVFYLYINIEMILFSIIISYSIAWKQCNARNKDFFLKVRFIWNAFVRRRRWAFISVKTG